jgi:hypothetical protein
VNQKSKSKYLWWGAAALVAVWFFKGLTPAPRPTPPQPNVAPATPAAVTALNTQLVTGKWRAVGPVVDRGNCQMNLELTSNVALAKTNGYVTLNCTGINIYAPGPHFDKGFVERMQNNRVPTSAVLSAPFTSGPVQFTVEKSVGGVCPISTFTVTLFGGSQLLAEWKDSCGNGQLVLSKTP